MNDNKIKKIISILVKNKENVHEGYRLWVRRGKEYPKTQEELIAFLCEIFEAEEKAIERERNRPYVTNDYENGVRGFAIALMAGLLGNYGTVDEMRSYVQLLGLRHMAYAFYHMLNTNYKDTYVITLPIENDITCKKALYSGLVTFYNAFYGSFSDNEEAICLLCKYYPKGDDSWLKREEVISALLSHITNAGTPNDFGYAFHGIEQIQTYISDLPNGLIRELIEQYALYDVLNQKVYRHQIFAIIDGSSMETEEKRLLKFFYLDSLLLANAFNTAWIDKETANNNRVEVYYNLYDVKLDKRQIQVLNEPNAFWDNQNRKCRYFWVKGRRVAGMSIKGKMIVLFAGKSKEKFPFVYNDWELEEFSSKKIRELITQMLLDKKTLSVQETFETEDNSMSFSLLYMDNYRGMQKRILDFDHKYTFNPDKGTLKRNKEERIPGLHFYGKAVYSLSCIVGKNGTGKTSIIDFLRDTFYEILKILEDFNEPCEDGYIGPDFFEKYDILDKESIFLVVFRVGKKDYFLRNTNDDDINVDGLLPYRKEVYRNLKLCKVAYFSQQMRADQIIGFENGIRPGKERKQGIAKTLEGLGQCDYSEIRSFVRKKNAYAGLHNWKGEILEGTGQIINRELCYLFSLLRNVGIDIICECLCVLPEKELVIYNLDTGKPLEEFLLKDCRDTALIKKIEKKYARMPNVEIGYFSSGQYAKLMFLAKLHWILAGYNKDGKYYEELFGRISFSREEALQKKESALIFIDEGELYYHPEWQRRFLKNILDMLNLCREEGKLQIVFSTNSPFVISDVLKEDVQYLSDKETDFGNTLGQNIHKLLKNNFFMDYTIGEYSRELIETLILLLSKKEKNDIKNTKGNYIRFADTQNKYELYEMMVFLIQQLGEPVYREKLETMLEQRIASDQTLRETKIQKLERQIADLEKEKERLRRVENGKD